MNCFSDCSKSMYCVLDLLCRRDYVAAFCHFIKETLINWRYERITSLHGTRSLAYPIDMSRLLCSVRLVLHLVCRINQRFLKDRSITVFLSFSVRFRFQHIQVECAQVFTKKETGYAEASIILFFSRRFIQQLPILMIWYTIGSYSWMNLTNDWNLSNFLGH